MIELLFSNEFLASVMRMATPLILTAMAANIGRQAGVVCYCFEGMMLFAAFGGVVGSWITNSLLLGCLIGIASGMTLALIFGYFIIYLDTQPLLMSLAMNTVGLAGTTFGCYMICGSKTNTTVLASKVFPQFKLEFLSDIPVIGGLLSNKNLLTFIALVSVPIVFYFLFNTPLGLKIRATGRNKQSAESVGIDTKRIKLITILIQGVLSSLGGMYMSMAYMPYFTTNMIAGRGFMAIAANNLGVGMPFATMLWAFLFAGSLSVGNILQSFNLPSEFAAMLPYVITLIGLCVGATKTGHKRKGKKKHVQIAKR